jgi:HEAT repeat protein
MITKCGTYKDQYKVIDALKGDSSPEAVIILDWLVFNGDHDDGIVMVKGDVRCSAIAGLAGIGGEQALDVLERAAKGDPSVRNDAEYYLTELKKNITDEKELLKSIDSSPESAFEALAEKRSPAGAKKAIEMLDSVNIYAVVAAMRYLGLLGVEEATDKLIELIDSRYIDIKHTAAIALGRIGGEKAKEALIKTLHYPFDEAHGSHEWAISGAVKGLAIMWADGETDVKEKVKEIKVNLGCNCSRDSYKEEQLHTDLTREMLNN